MAKIAIDARFYGRGHTGLGRYTTNVLNHLPKFLGDHTLQILLRDAEYDNFKLDPNIQKIHAELPHYSVKEQLQLPFLLKSLKSDLLYTLHFVTPIFSSVPTIITVHDLIKTHFSSSDTTTHNPLMFTIKRAGYNLAIKQSLSKARDIISPSNTVKNDILAAFPSVKPELIHAIAEAPDQIFRSKSKNLKDFKNLINLPQDYILFVGNAYPHKNLKVLLDAMSRIKDQKLVIVAKSTPFLIHSLAPYNRENITLLSDLTDEELVAVYSRATILVTPSYMEGYGLVGLESLMVGTQVIASNIPVYREVYGNRVKYFDPDSVSSLIEAIKESNKSKKRSPLNFPRSWDDVARSIAEVINARCTSL